MSEKTGPVSGGVPIKVLDERRDALARELAVGQRRLVELDHQRVEVERTMQRILGAMQLVDELVAEARRAPGPELAGTPAEVPQ